MEKAPTSVGRPGPEGFRRSRDYELTDVFPRAPPPSVIREAGIIMTSVIMASAPMGRSR